MDRLERTTNRDDLNLDLKRAAYEHWLKFMRMLTLLLDRHDRTIVKMHFRSHEICGECSHILEDIECTEQCLPLLDRACEVELSVWLAGSCGNAAVDRGSFSSLLRLSVHGCC